MCARRMGGRSPGDCGRLGLWTNSESEAKRKSELVFFLLALFLFGREQTKNKPRTMREQKKERRKGRRKKNVFKMIF